MEFNREGLEEFFTDGVLNPATTSEAYSENCSKYKELGSRVFVLYEPDPALYPGGAEFDIVLLHGIGSDEFKCWTNTQGIIWPAVFFPQDFPTARVLTVGYAHSLFNWEADSAAEEVTAKPLTLSPSTSADAGAREGAKLASDAASAKTAEEEAGALHHLRSIADRVGQTAKASVSSYAPKEVSQWWAGATPPRERNTEETNLQQGDAEKQSSHEQVNLSTAAARTTDSKTSWRAENPLFQLLTSIRDSTGSLVAAEDASSAGNLSGTAPEAQSSSDAQRANPSRDVRSLQNMRIVAAEVAERLGSAKVGVGQRPLVFLVHSMGGLILKQMLISLFEAARLAPPSAAALSLAAVPDAAEQTPQEAAVQQNCAAVHKANVLLRAVRGVVFYGTPHFGSAVASVITGLQKYYQGLGGLTPTSVVTGLGDHNKQELMRLNDRFFDVVERIGDELSMETAGPATADVLGSHGKEVTASYVSAMKTSLVQRPSAWTTSLGSIEPMEGRDGGNVEGGRGNVWVMSFGETKKLNGLVLVVDPESSNPAPDDPRYPFYLVNADHSEVCRPLTKMSPSYAMVYGLLDRMQQRGVLKWQHKPTTALPQLTESSVSEADDVNEKDARSSALEKLSSAYESGWSELFHPARLAPAASEEAEHNLLSETGEDTVTRASDESFANQRCLAAYQQGLGEMRLALPVLEEALAELHQLLHRFFGVAIPPQLDCIFLLAADVTDFVTRFYRREALILQTPPAAGTPAAGAGEALANSGAEGEGNCATGKARLVDEVVSFRIPLQVLTYWVRQAVNLLRVFELSQQERAIGMSVTSGVSPTAARWESNLSLHPGSRDLRELSELEQSVGVVQEEWEAFRRYVSLRIRSTSAASSPTVAHAQRRGSERLGSPAKGPRGGVSDSGDVTDFSAREHIAVLFFARGMRTIASQHLHDGGALGGLLGAYLRSAIVQIRGAEKQLSAAHFTPNPWRLIEYTGATDTESIVALVMEGLELSLAPPSNSNDSSVLTDTSGIGVSLTTSSELRAAVPALTATSSLLLGCFALFVDTMHRLDGGARWPRAAQYFELTNAALTADAQVRRRLLQTASRTIKSEGLLTAPLQGKSAAARGSEKEWWKGAGWGLSATKAAPSSADGASATGVVGAVFADNHQAHVARLDDGLFLSAMQLVAASFQCSILLRSYDIRHTLANISLSSLDEQQAADFTAKQNGSRAVHSEDAKERGTPSDNTLDSLARSVESAQKIYQRIQQILQGVFVLSDAEKPFASLSRKGDDAEKSSQETTTTQPEKSVKDQLRDAIQSILSELDDDGNASEEENSGGATQTRAKSRLSTKSAKGSSALTSTSTSSVATAAATASPAGKKKGRKNSLPMLIMNSLTKAWEAVRSGGAAAETPEHFAYTAMVMWWMVEWEAASVIKGAAAASQVESADESTMKFSRVKLRGLLDTMNAAQQRRQHVTGHTPTTPKQTKATTSAKSKGVLSFREKEAEAAEKACWSSANTAVRCKWMILRGGEDFLRGFHQDLIAERETLDQILSSRSVRHLREIEENFVPPAALSQLDGEGGTQLGIPASLLDAVQHDDTSAALRCWLGHCYAAHRMGSPDTAHAYVQVIRNDYAAHKKYTTTAEVGLAWNHLHNVSCSFAQLWRPSLESRAIHHESPSVTMGPKKTTGVNGGELRTMKSLLDFRSTGVIDTSALHSVPLALKQFCHDAVVHHTNAVGAYVASQQPSTPLSPGDRTNESSLSLLRPASHGEAVRHLRFAEEGFQRALRTDPANIGALCGLGRLRCLSVTPSGSSLGVYDAHGPSSGDSGLAYSPSVSSLHRESASSTQRGARAASSAEARCFFAAALDVAAHRRVEGGAKTRDAAWCASPESCAHAMDGVWLSYAAYWMSEEARRARVTRGGAAAASESTEWLTTALRHYPRNDWALTSLGLYYLQSSSQTARADGEGACTVDQDTQRGVRGYDSGGKEVFQLRGLTLLQRALTINPTNMWALWGVGTYGGSVPHRTTCQKLLRSLLLKNLPRL